MAAAVLTFLGLAITDAINPFTVAAMAVLLTLDRPVARGAIFSGVTFGVYLVFAILLAEGLAAAAATLLPALPDWVPGTLLIGLAVLCIGFSLYLWFGTEAADVTVSLASALTLPGTAAFAVVSTLSDAPTAVPLFAAVAQLAQMAEERPRQYLWLAAYTLVYVAPLLLLLGLRIALGARAKEVLGRVTAVVNWSFQHLLPPVLAIAGGLAGWAGVALLAGAA